MARVRPGSKVALLGIRGVGERKLADLGQRFLELIATHCRANGLPLDTALGSRPRRERIRKPNDAKETAFELFANGASVEQVTTRTGRTVSTTWATSQSSSKITARRDWNLGSTQRYIERLPTP